jgi:hypothetical protein
MAVSLATYITEKFAEMKGRIDVEYIPQKYDSI